jgi:hypothetical protein
MLRRPPLGGSAVKFEPDPVRAYTCGRTEKGRQRNLTFEEFGRKNRTQAMTNSRNCLHDLLRAFILDCSDRRDLSDSTAWLARY